MADRKWTEAEREIIARCALEREHDIGNARRFLAWSGDDVRHVTNIGWHAYDGKRWHEDESLSITRRMAHVAAEAIYAEVPLVEPSEADRDLIDAARIARDALDNPPDAKLLSRQELADLHVERMAWQRQIDQAEAAQERLAALRASRRRHAKSTCGTSKLNAMLTEAAAYRSAEVGDLNRDLYALNVGNGTIKFERIASDFPGDRDGMTWEAKLHPHSRDDMISKLAPVDYDRRAAEPVEWLRFLERVQPEKRMRAYLQRLAGYCLLGLNTEQVIAFFYGIGRNGKSTFVDTLARILADYAVTLSIDSFAGEDRRSGAEATPDLARLPGARYVAASEPENGVRLKEALIKRLTGGEPIAVRRLHKDFFEFDPQFTLIISGNHKPQIIGNDDGIWRRIHLVPWEVQIPKEEVDKGLPRRLLDEAPGILNWAIAGALTFLNSGGLHPPEEIVNATQEYREEEDPIGAFIRNACEVTGEASDEEKPLDLFLSYERFATDNGIVKVKETTFYRRLPEAARRGWPGPDGQTMNQFHKVKTSGTMVWRGIRIRDEWVPRSSYHDHDQGRD